MVCVYGDGGLVPGVPRSSAVMSLTLLTCKIDKLLFYFGMNSKNLNVINCNKITFLSKVIAACEHMVNRKVRCEIYIALYGIHI